MFALRVACFNGKPLVPFFTSVGSGCDRQQTILKDDRETCTIKCVILESLQVPIVKTIKSVAGICGDRENW